MCFSNTEYIKRVFDGVFKCPSTKTLKNEILYSILSRTIAVTIILAKQRDFWGKKFKIEFF